MDPVDNNQFEVKPSSKNKRKVTAPCPNAYLNPALDLLANEDPMCNTAMEIVPIKKRKRTRSCDIASFENTALDLGISKTAVNEFLVRELENVRKNVRSYTDVVDDEDITNSNESEPIYENLPQNNATNEFPDISKALSIQNDTESSKPDISEIGLDSGISILEHKSNTLEYEKDMNLSAISTTRIQTSVNNQIFVNKASNLSLSFIDRLALDSPILSNQSLHLDDDLNESNIMEIKTITIITTKKRGTDKKKNTNPFLDPNIETMVSEPENPFLCQDKVLPELEYNEAANIPAQGQITQSNLVPRRLFTTDTNSTISTVNESSLNLDQHEYENVDGYRSESPIYENVSEEAIDKYSKQSRILGHDISQFSAVDIMNLNRNNQGNNSNDSNESKKDFKHQILKASNKLSKKVMKTLKKTFKSEKVDNNVTLNPYEVPRKPPKQKVVAKESGIENPALKLDNSDEIEMDEMDDSEHQYETIKTIRNTRLNTNVTPLKERDIDNIDYSHNKTNTPGKKVRFDSTLNQEKVITGNSFDYDIQSPGFDAKIDKFHDELENCINERKFLQHNM